MVDGIGELHVAPCPKHEEYALIETAITGSDGLVAVKLGCGCEVRMEFFNGEEPFEDCGHFPDDEALVEEAMYDG